MFSTAPAVERLIKQRRRHKRAPSRKLLAWPIFLVSNNMSGSWNHGVVWALKPFLNKLSFWTKQLGRIHKQHIKCSMLTSEMQRSHFATDSWELRTVYLFNGHLDSFSGTRKAHWLSNKLTCRLGDDLAIVKKSLVPSAPFLCPFARAKHRGKWHLAQPAAPEAIAQCCLI